jgi:hypothetical protein
MNTNLLLYLKSFGIWVILAISAIAVAVFRNGVLLPPFGEQTAHQVGTLLYLILQFLIIYLFVKKSDLKKYSTLLSVGIYWLVLTIIFEFIFGHYVIGHSWEKLFADYNISEGRLWVLVLINNVTAPLISGKLIRD